METFKCSKCEIDVIKSECKNRSMMCFSCNKQKLKEKQKELMRQYYIKNRDEYNLKNIEKYYGTTRENLVYHQKPNGRYHVTKIIQTNT